MLKRNILLMSLILGFFTTGQTQPGGWGKISVPTTENLRGVWVQDSDAWYSWAVGENGTILKNRALYTISIPGFAQTDYHFNDVCAVGSYVWIVGQKKDAPNKYMGVILRTIDGGSTWEYRLATMMPAINSTIAPFTPFLQVKFDQNGVVGYIACGNGNVLMSPDRGASWSRCTSPNNNPDNPWNPQGDNDSLATHYVGLWVDPTTPSNLWVSADQCGMLAKSTDGGVSWRSSRPFNQTYAFPPSPPYTDLCGLPSADKNTKLANFKLTQDYLALSYGHLGNWNGAVWTLKTLEPEPTWFYDVNPIWAVGSEGIIDAKSGAQWNFNRSYHLRSIGVLVVF